MNRRLAAIVVTLCVLTESLAAQPHPVSIAPASKVEQPTPALTPQKANFVDIAERAGLTAKTEDGGDKTKRYIIETTGSGAAFFDFDNDGWPDIFMANGHVYPELDSKGLGLGFGFNSTFRERKLLYWNEHDGRFRDISLDAGPGITTPFNGHGVAATDFDNDGAVEILVNNSHDRPSLLKNLGERGNWILLKLEGTKSNRDAIGARVTVRAGDHQQTQEVRSGGGYISQSDFRLHFGLGKATRADAVEIRWPSGLAQRFENVGGNQVVRIREGIGLMKN
jgi:enediyne biosynthesis protein E4